MSVLFVPIATYGTGVEADMAKAQLESAGILVLSQGENVGIFGPGFGGQVVGGIVISVPEPVVDQARALLGLPELVPDNAPDASQETPKE